MRRRRRRRQILFEDTENRCENRIKTSKHQLKMFLIISLSKYVTVLKRLNRCSLNLVLGSFTKFLQTSKFWLKIHKIHKSNEGLNAFLGSHVPERGISTRRIFTWGIPAEESQDIYKSRIQATHLDCKDYKCVQYTMKKLCLIVQQQPTTIATTFHENFKAFLGACVTLISGGEIYVKTGVRHPEYCYL
jgi:hypothetical protein